jgi:amino acid adenylation domain-containing protein
VQQQALSPTTVVRQQDYPRDLCVHQLLEEACRENQSSVAVEFEGTSVTYAELHRRANQLARVLRANGVGREVLVGICLERSLEMAVALLGVLKAGGAYVPLDPSYGAGRIQYVLDEARVKVLITQQPLLQSLPPTSAKVLCIDTEHGLLEAESGDPIAIEVAPHNLAYVIYTSGSTGKPKGVQLEHRSVVNFLCSVRRDPGLDASDVLVAVTTLSFDIAGLEMFLPLLCGARLVIASRQATTDGVLLMRLLERSRATVMQATPATWRLLFESGWTGNAKFKVLVGGEALSPDLGRRLASCCGEVWNMYGPTETTIWSSTFRVHGRDERTVPIGYPIANTSFYVLEGGQPVEPGADGELYIGGEGLARGYFERAELTREKFVADPFSPVPGARMYRTGDLVRCRPDGAVEYLGRLDHQVKIRGYRIELGEVEAVLEQHPAVRQAVAMARDGEAGDRYLVAYYLAAPATKPSISELRRHLRCQLPEYMIPSAFVRVQEFPLTANGKVDRKALPPPSNSADESDREYVAPRNAIERRLAALWEETLQVGRIGVSDNFFEIGGRSILAARLFMKISRQFGRELPLSTLAQAPTVELLARILDGESKETRYSTLVALQASGSKPPFFCIHGGAGSTLFLKLLAERLGPDQPFYGVEPDGLDGRRFRNATVEQMATYYLSEIRRVQPAGPYYLAGYCFGGLVAFEMAQQLLHQGENAAAVILLTAPLRFRGGAACSALRRERQVSKPLRAKLATFLASPGSMLCGLAVRLKGRLWYKLQPTTFRTLLACGLRVPQSLRTDYVGRTLGAAERAYDPKPYSGSLILFSGADNEHFGENQGWSGLATSFEHHIIGQGDHLARRDLFDEPLVAETAREMAACLETARSTATAKSVGTTAN